MTEPKSTASPGLGGVETASEVVDILILGAGWTSTFIISLCKERGLTTASTTRDGREGSIVFVFDPTSEDTAPYAALPMARTVLISFPITVKGASARLVNLYKSTHTGSANVRFIQLGTTSIWKANGNTPEANKWYDRHSPYTPGNERAEAEDELLSLNPGVPTTVLNLSGLWGGDRIPKNWLKYLPSSKEALRTTPCLHLVHGRDVARAILAVHASFDLASGSRWILTDGRIYDWWDLASAWGGLQNGPQPKWVSELMKETGVKALPRNPEVLGRVLDSREFWETFDVYPTATLISEKE
jgi:hypothetical protein